MRSLLFLTAALILTACTPDKPPPTPLPTKDKTIDRVNAELQRAQQQSADRLKEAEDALNPPAKPAE